MEFDVDWIWIAVAVIWVVMRLVPRLVRGAVRQAKEAEERSRGSAPEPTGTDVLRAGEPPRPIDPR